MQQIEKELRLNQLKLIVIVATIIFAFMLVYTIYWLTDYKKEYGFFQKGEAVVIEHQEIDGKTYDLLSYVVNDNEFRITTEYESKNDIGDMVTIFYDENYPLGVVYSLDSRRIVLPILSTVFAVTNVALVVVYFLIRKSIKNPIQENIDEVAESESNIIENDVKNDKPKEIVEVKKETTKPNSIKTTKATSKNSATRNSNTKSQKKTSTNKSAVKK